MIEPHDNPVRREHGLDGKFVIMSNGKRGLRKPVTTVLDVDTALGDDSCHASGPRECRIMIEGFKFDHMGVAVQDIHAAILVYQDLFGYKLLSGPYDDPQQQATVAFLGLGEPHEFVVELIAPLGKGSHVARLLEKGGGAYHVCYEVADIERTLTDLRSMRCLIVREPAPAVAYQGRRIAWIMLPTRQLMELVESGGPGR